MTKALPTISNLSFTEPDLSKFMKPDLSKFIKRLIKSGTRPSAAEATAEAVAEFVSETVQANASGFATKEQAHTAQEQTTNIIKSQFNTLKADVKTQMIALEEKAELRFRRIEEMIKLLREDVKDNMRDIKLLIIAVIAGGLAVAGYAVHLVLQRPGI